MSIIILYENQGEITKNGVIVKGNWTVTPLLKVSTMAGAPAPGMNNSHTWAMSWLFHRLADF